MDLDGYQGSDEFKILLNLYGGIEGGVFTPAIKGLFNVFKPTEHVLYNDNTRGVEYSNIPVYGRKMLNGFEMGEIGGDKEVGESKGNKIGKEKEKKVITDLSLKNPFAALDGLKEEGEEKENKKLNKEFGKTKIENNNEEEKEENCKENCEEVECEDEDEIGDLQTESYTVRPDHSAHPNRLVNHQISTHPLLQIHMLTGDRIILMEETIIHMDTTTVLINVAGRSFPSLLMALENIKGYFAILQELEIIDHTTVQMA
uniref:Uncharacterized protein n=1 Tax=Meloidogyne javanica TaxID=6303 RepID=A0A915N757_MELJA